MVGHNISLNKFNKIEVIFLDNSRLKLSTQGKNSNTWRLRNMLLNNEWVNSKIKRKNQKVPGNK